MRCKVRRALFPEHIVDLEKSGISLSYALSEGIYSSNRNTITKLLGYPPNNVVQSALVFPYSNKDFFRLKLFPSYKGPEGTTKYLQPQGSSPHLYVPKFARKALETPGDYFFITEGEKKALAACQKGLPCIAIGGLWNWIRKGQPIADLDDINWLARGVGLVPDSDVWESERSDLFCAVFAFGKELNKRGATSDLIIIPKGERL